MRIEGLFLRIGERNLMYGVSLRIGPGETHVLLGASGSGETALLKAVMGRPRQVVSGELSG